MVWIFSNFENSRKQKHNQRNEFDFRTALHLAAAYNRNIDVTKFLVEHGANLEAKTNGGW